MGYLSRQAEQLLGSGVRVAFPDLQGNAGETRNYLASPRYHSAPNITPEVANMALLRDQFIAGGVLKSISDLKKQRPNSAEDTSIVMTYGAAHYGVADFLKHYSPDTWKHHLYFEKNTAEFDEVRSRIIRYQNWLRTPDVSE